MLMYAPAANGGSYGVLLYEHGNPPFQFARDSSYDNHPSRPAGLPANSVAFTAIATVSSNTQHADLMAMSTTSPTGWTFVDEIDSFTPNQLVLIQPD